MKIREFSGRNSQAVGFYTHLGFEINHQTVCDRECDPYPLYMKLP